MFLKSLRLPQHLCRGNQKSLLPQISLQKATQAGIVIHHQNMFFGLRHCGFLYFFFLAGAFLAACPVLAADFAFGADFAAVFRTGVLLFSAFSAETFFSAAEAGWEAAFFCPASVFT